MQENHNFFAFYYQLSDIVNSTFNLREKIPESKIVRKILRSLLESFKVTTTEENKDADSMRVDEFVSSLHTYEITLPDSQKPKEFAFEASKNKEKESKNSKSVGREELVHMGKTC